MVTSLERTFIIPAGPDRVVGAIRNPRLIEESERSRGALTVRVTDRRRTETEHEYQIQVTAPARSATGIDRTKTEENRIEVRWDLARRSGKWTWYGPHGPRVRVTGGYDVAECSRGSELRLHAEIEIGIPVVGKMVEKKVSAGFEASWPGYAALIEKFASEAAA